MNRTRVIVLLFLIAAISCGPTTSNAQQPRADQDLTTVLPIDDYLTPLMRAAGKGSVSEVRSLLKAGANVNEKMQLGITALTLAASAGHLDVVKVLLEAGADPNAWGGMSHPRIIITVLTSAMQFRKKNRMEIVDTLIAAGAKVNPPGSFPESPLVFAVRERDLEMIQALLDRGADVNWSDEFGRTPLVESLSDANGPDVRVVRLLLMAGANPNKSRLWSGDECVSILVHLEGWLKHYKDRPRAEAKRLLLRHGAKRYKVPAAETGCTAYNTPSKY